MNELSTLEIRSGPIISNSNKFSVSQLVEPTIAPRLAEVRRCVAEVLCAKTNAIEAVHDLRVSTRRALVALDFMSGAIDRKSRRALAKQLRKLCRRAGRVRDLDVMIERIRERKLTETQPFLESLREKRDALYVTLEAFLRKSDRNFSFKIHLDCSHPKHDRRNRRLAGSFASWAQCRIAKLAKWFFRISQRSFDNARSLHRLRIQARKMRYTLEILAPIAPNIHVSPVYSLLQKLQELLGEMNDSNVLCKIIKEHRGGQQGSSSDRFLKRQSRTQSKKQAECLSQLQTLWSKEAQMSFSTELRKMLEFRVHR
jgi:CHAD domain-containing protein